MERGVYMRRRGSRTHMRALLMVVLLLAGSTGAEEPPARATVDPPTGGGWAECPPAASRAIAVAFRAEATNATQGRPAGIHRLDARSFLYVWGDFQDTLREDRISRVNPVEVARDAIGVVHVSTRIDVAAPTDVDAERRSYAVGARLVAEEALPEGPLRVVVNWVAGCPCDPLPRGNATASFEP